MYQIIYDFLLGLFPTSPEAWQIAFCELTSLATLTWLYVLALGFVVYIFKWVSNLVWWR